MRSASSFSLPSSLGFRSATSSFASLSWRSFCSAAEGSAMPAVMIVAAKRTAIGSFQGHLATVPATKLGSTAVQAALEFAKIDPNNVGEVFFGNVLSANLGQAPAKQISLGAGIPSTVPCTTVNKVCASGMKSIMLGAQSIMTKAQDMVVTGGAENMSMVPHYLNGRKGVKAGPVTAVDGLFRDGLTDAYDDCPMGVFAENIAEELEITREEQDAYTAKSYELALSRLEVGSPYFENVSVEVKTKAGTTHISVDEEPQRVKFEKIPNLPAAFVADGTVTAANSSTMNDGAAALVLASEEKAKELELAPEAKILGFADASLEPEKFTVAPATAIPLALAKAGLEIEDIDLFEINEAFAVVALANQKILDIPAEKLNIYGGAVALGHPIGASGARIVVTLIDNLRLKNKRYGCASICNGGGGASAIVVENMHWFGEKEEKVEEVAEDATA